MFIKYFDYLSPRVTFYYKGYLSHSSIVSGIISIIAITFVIILVVNYLVNIFQRENPNAFYFHSFIENAGLFQLNTSSLFHFLNIVTNFKGYINNEGIDFTLFNVIGVQSYVESYLNQENKTGIFAFDHWLYGYCNKEMNTFEIDDLITYGFFEKCACIKHFYNSTERKYYEIGDPKFAWPEIAYGTFNENNKLYGIYIQKCNNTILKNIFGEGNQYECKNDSEIDKFFNFHGTPIMHLYFINNYINILDFNNPNNKFFYRIENPLNKEQYSTNDININPILLKSHVGLVIDNIKEDVSYMFDRNDVYIGKKDNKNLYICYCFFLKNIMEYYERTYKRVQDVISNIGGINQTITIFAIYLNFLYNKFIVLSDTEILLHSLIHTEKKIHIKKAIRLSKLKSKINNLEKPENNEIKKTTERKEIKNDKKIKIDNKNNKNENDLSKTNNNFINFEEKNINEKFGIRLNNNDLDKIFNNDKESMKRHKRNNNFCKFIFYKLTCQKKQDNYKVYEKFIIKIISEEHLIRNHLNIYNLLKVTERKRHSRKSNYELKDLIKFV